MFRSLITPETNKLDITIPDDYVGKKVEVLLFTQDDTIEAHKATSGITAQFWGVISDKITEKMHRHLAQSRAERDI